MRFLRVGSNRKRSKSCHFPRFVIDSLSLGVVARRGGGWLQRLSLPGDHRVPHNHTGAQLSR